MASAWSEPSGTVPSGQTVEYTRARPEEEATDASFQFLDWTSKMIFHATATPEELEKQAEESKYQAKLKRELVRQNMDMKTVLELKKLMYEDPVDVQAVQHVARARGLVSNRVRKKLWPKLLGLNPHQLEATSVSYQRAAGKGHADAGIVFEDVRRSAWIRLQCENAGSSKVSMETQQMRQLQRVINGVIASNAGAAHYVQGLHEVAAVLFMVLGETSSYQVLEVILLHHLRDGSGSKEGVDLIMNHLRLFAFLLDKVDPEMLHILKMVLEEAEIDDQTDMELKIMFLPWILTWFSAVLIPEPTGDKSKSQLASERKAAARAKGGGDSMGDMLGGLGGAAAATAEEEEEAANLAAPFQDRLAVCARLFDLFIVSDPLMPVYMGVALLKFFKPLIIKKQKSKEGMRNPSQVGRWVVHQLPAMIDCYKLPAIVEDALFLHDTLPPHKLMADGLMLPYVSSFYTYPYLWMDQPLRIDSVLQKLSNKDARTERYEGERNNVGELHGYGRYYYPNGNVYMGKFEEGMRSGLGHFVWARTNEKYEGEWKHDERHGLGVHNWHDGTSYQGQFRNNKMEGNGVYLWPDGRRFDGRFKMDKQHGLGVFTQPDGRTFAAEWVEGAVSRMMEIEMASGAVEEALEAQQAARKRKVTLMELLHYRSKLVGFQERAANVSTKTKVLAYLGFKKYKDKLTPPAPPERVRFEGL